VTGRVRPLPSRMPSWPALSWRGGHRLIPYGDYPVLICELVDWALACGFTVAAAGKSTKYLLRYHQSTPDTVWSYYGFTEEQVAAGDVTGDVAATVKRDLRT
jgi:hypothetical protein